MALLLGIIFRVAVSSITNVVVLLWVAPDYLKFSASILRVIGFNISSETEALMLTLWFNAIFNIIHVFLSSIVAYMVFKATAKILPSTPKTMKEV
jgi:riboflavin transporter FmnP